ncbi:MAG: type II toxin-antitoxin system HicA family toxin [Holophagales bacterium]|jgi:predicted RNA binding protein YcfA (HicA-like mRNA interferase family)|nr:type II toxin-antitoxin system HicA family toxin [Holophagales bacterium]
MKFRELEKIIKADGWRLQNVEGSHYQYTHDEKRGKVTIPYSKGELSRKTLNSALKQAGLK